MDSGVAAHLCQRSIDTFQRFTYEYLIRYFDLKSLDHIWLNGVEVLDSNTINDICKKFTLIAQTVNRQSDDSNEKKLLENKQVEKFPMNQIYSAIVVIQVNHTNRTKLKANEIATMWKSITFDLEMKQVHAFSGFGVAWPLDGRKAVCYIERE